MTNQTDQLKQKAKERFYERVNQLKNSDPTEKVVEFGFRYETSNGWTHTATDFGNIWKFIETLIDEAYFLGKMKVVSGIVQLDKK